MHQQLNRFIMLRFRQGPRIQELLRSLMYEGTGAFVGAAAIQIYRNELWPTERPVMLFCLPNSAGPLRRLCDEVGGRDDYEHDDIGTVVRYTWCGLLLVVVNDFDTAPFPFAFRTTSLAFNMVRGFWTYASWNQAMYDANQLDFDEDVVVGWSVVQWVPAIDMLNDMIEDNVFHIEGDSRRRMIRCFMAAVQSEENDDDWIDALELIEKFTTISPYKNLIEVEDDVTHESFVVFRRNPEIVDTDSLPTICRDLVELEDRPCGPDDVGVMVAVGESGWTTTCIPRNQILVGTKFFPCGERYLVGVAKEMGQPCLIDVYSSSGSFTVSYDALVSALRVGNFIRVVGPIRVFDLTTSEEGASGREGSHVSTNHCQDGSQKDVYAVEVPVVRSRGESS